jgi:predicted MFS family arabinose efflux permease
VPIGLAAAHYARRFLREHREPAAGGLDVSGYLCSGGGMALVPYALSRAPTTGWTSGPMLVSGLTGIVLFAVLVAIEAERPDPLLHLRLCRNRMFRAGILVMSIAYAPPLGVLLLLPLFLQQLLGPSAFDSGLTTLPQAIGMVLMTQATSRLYPRLGPRRMLAVALAGLIATSALFLLVGLHADLWWIRRIMLLGGVSLSFALVAGQAATFAIISSTETGRAWSLFDSNRQGAASVGVAVLATCRGGRGRAGASVAAT